MSDSGKGPGRGGPAKGSGKGPARGTRPQFAPGNVASVVHGARSERAITEQARFELQRLADERGDLIERYPQEAEAYARATAIVSLLWSYGEQAGLIDEETGEPRGSLSKELSRWFNHAQSCRDRMGLSPLAQSRLGRPYIDPGPAYFEASLAEGQARVRELHPEWQPRGIDTDSDPTTEDTDTDEPGEGES